MMSEFVVDLTCVACPDDCTDSSQGTCDTSNGICYCKTGFSGDNCAGYGKYFRAVCNQERHIVAWVQ